MRNYNLTIFAFSINLILFSSTPALSRCAVCVVSGMSGASIAVLIILTVFILLGLANWGLRKFLNKN